MSGDALDVYFASLPSDVPAAQWPFTCASCGQRRAAGSPGWYVTGNRKLSGPCITRPKQPGLKSMCDGRHCLPVGSEAMRDA